MKKSLHLFDLDYTLWRIDSKMAIIDKNEPDKVLLRISPDEKDLLKEFYKKDNLEIYYNGEKWYLSPKIWENIKEIKKGLDLTDIGLSFREFTDTETLENQVKRTDYLLENLTHLKDSYIEVGILSARSNKKGDRKNLSILTEKMERILGTKVNKIYFVNDIENSEGSDTTSYRKAKIVLEHLLGFKIKKGKFSELKQDIFDHVSFYDDDENNIDAVAGAQRLLEKFLPKTEVDIKKEILERLKNNKIFIDTYLITQNKMNPFIKNENMLLSPNYIKLYGV